jgi:uncharacterized protein (TIGR02145 family)
MKRIALSIIFVSLCIYSIAQVPESFNYQAIPRNSSGGSYPDQPMRIRINILSGSPTGSSVYCETFAQTTTSIGMLNLQIGKGTFVSGSFTTINWGANSFYLKIEIDPSGGIAYVEMGTTQLLSVPYAMQAKTAANYTETDPVFVAHTTNGITSTNITNWNSAYGWGNHAGLYRPLSYVPSWSEITSNPFSFVSLANNQLLKYNTASSKFENWTPDFLTSYTETDPVWTTASVNYYTKTNMQTSSTSQLHFNNLTNKPTTVAGYGITDAVITSGNQTIAGNKTFSGTTTVVTPVNATDAVSKEYVDGLKQQIKILEDNLIAAGTFKLADVEGNQYNVVKIGTQVWMKENLKTTKYNDGTAIPNITDYGTWVDATTGAYCDYNNTPSNSTTYGRLYNWHAVDNNTATKVASNGGKNACPTGWHVPSDNEWTTLTDYLTNNGYGYGGSGSDIAKSMAATSGWTTDPTAGNVGNDQASNNSSGFTALPSGFRSSNSTFNNIGDYGTLWSSTEYSTAYAYYRIVYYSNTDVERLSNYKGHGFSVRCLRDF